MAGIAIVFMGLHFLGLTPINTLMRQARMEVAKPVGLWSAYGMGLCRCLRLDAVHRPDPGGDPRGGGIGGDGRARRQPAAGLFARARHSVPAGWRLRSNSSQRSLRASATSPPKVEQVAGGLLALTGIAFLTGFMTYASFWLLDMPFRRSAGSKKLGMED